MKSVQNDMTVGSPMKMILSFTFPIFLGNVFKQFYNMADAVIVRNSPIKNERIPAPATVRRIPCISPAPNFCSVRTVNPAVIPTTNP